MARRGPHGSNGGSRGPMEAGVCNTGALRRTLLGVLVGAALVIICVQFRPGALTRSLSTVGCILSCAGSRGWGRSMPRPDLSAEVAAQWHRLPSSALSSSPGSSRCASPARAGMRAVQKRAPPHRHPATCFASLRSPCKQLVGPCTFRLVGLSMRVAQHTNCRDSNAFGVPRGCSSPQRWCHAERPAEQWPIVRSVEGISGKWGFAGC